MIKLSPKTNLLEQDSYHYPLVDVTEPNLHREVFPYDEVPKVQFNHTRVPLGMPSEIWMTDTSFRDGQQSRAPYSVEQIVDLYKMLSRLGGPNGLIRQTEFFVYSETDRTALRRCQDLGLKFPEITTWIRATLSDFKLIRDMGIRETGVLRRDKSAQQTVFQLHNERRLGGCVAGAIDKKIPIAFHFAFTKNESSSV